MKSETSQPVIGSRVIKCKPEGLAMSDRKNIVTWVIIVSGILVAISIFVVLHRRQPVVLKGAVLRADPDPSKQSPIANVQITASNGLGSANSTSDAAGFFTLTLPKGLRRRQPLRLQFRHSDYRTLDLDDFVGDKIYVAHMVPIQKDGTADSGHPQVVISNTRIRYSVKSATEVNIGSAVKTFQVPNLGNRPCDNRSPCSPGLKWKAALGSASLDAGHGNEFRNARASCIAGPCPFTRIETEDLADNRSRFNVSVLNWSDTATFLLEAEVVRPMSSDKVNESYPVIFGRSLNFSLPASAEGLSIEADVDGEAIVFPLGPDLILRWADCHVGIEKDQSRTYRCDLKPGYRFK